MNNGLPPRPNTDGCVSHTGDEVVAWRHIVNDLPPGPDTLGSPDDLWLRNEWIGLPELPPTYKWTAYAGDPAIIKKNRTTPVAWITEKEPIEIYVCMPINETQAHPEATAMEVCHILATRCWLGEF